MGKKKYGKSAVPKWNFHKILINKDGKVEDTYSSFTKPLSKKLLQKLIRYYKFKVQSIVSWNYIFW